MRFFIDTNVLIYTRDSRDRQKQETAILWLTELARRDLAVINLQVLNELCYVIFRKMPHIGMDELRAWIGELQSWGETVVDTDITAAAWEIRATFRYNWFDCILLSAANRLGCTYLLSEDMTHGAIVGAVTIVSPFELEPSAILPPLRH
jgi:predicted nucleic acid-binding protein